MYLIPSFFRILMYLCVFHILQYGALQCHIQDLNAAADAEYGPSGHKKQPDQFHFILISSNVDVVAAGPSFTIEGWVDVSAACQQQSRAVYRVPQVFADIRPYTAGRKRHGVVF